MKQEPSFKVVTQESNGVFTLNTQNVSWYNIEAARAEAIRLLRARFPMLNSAPFHTFNEAAKTLETQGVVRSIERMTVEEGNFGFSFHLP